VVEAASQRPAPGDRRIHGVTVGQVVANCDSSTLGRVQVRLPWLPGYEPWARVAGMMAGEGRGTYFMPQVGDEVLVAFNHGDVRDAYVVGSVWNGKDRPPADAPNDAVDRRVIRTPRGHELAFDDASQTITIETAAEQRISLGPDSIEISSAGGAAKVVLERSGAIRIEASTELELKGASVRIEGEVVELKASSALSVDGGTLCQVQATLVKIN
jgi:phage baseplate assembly protein V